MCGNVTMTQIALGIDPEPLAVAPFIMTARRLPPVTAADFGVRIHPRAPAFVFPALGAYVGGDIIAGMLATGLTRDRRLRLFIDVGTNSEIALGSNERVVATAAPAGPAFEAAQIRCGMRAAEGAIEGVKIAGDDLALEVIGDAPPVGMCGSGLVDAVAQLVSAGLLDHSGRFVPDEEAAEAHPGLAPRLVKVGEERVFVLAWRGDDPANAIYLSQRDVRELQFAKASIATGWHILLTELGVTAADITQVLLAGSFGSYLSPASAVRIGLVPKLPLPRIISAGNVAGEGAEDGGALAPRARGGRRDPRGGRVRRALGTGRLQRHVRRPAGVSRMRRIGVIACGALALHVKAIARRRGWPVDVHPLPPELHNRPELIAPAVEELAGELDGTYDRLVVAYADCGTFGAVDRLGVERLAGDHCYDVFAGDDVRRAMAEEPGTYFLTDFLARTFDRTVWRSLGLDRHPDLRDAYFKNYTRVVYLSQRPTPELRAAAARAAQMLGLPLEEREVGEGGLERRLEELVEGVHA